MVVEDSGTPCSSRDARPGYLRSLVLDLALICKGGNHISTLSHTPVVRKVMRSDKMGTDD